MTTITNPFLRALAGFQSTGCDYCTFGGFAVVMYGVQRFTPDINLSIAPKAENLAKFWSTIEETGLSLMGSEELSDAKSRLTKELVETESNTEISMMHFQDEQAPGFQLQLMWGLPLSYSELCVDQNSYSHDGVDFNVCSPLVLAKLKSMSPRSQDKYEAAVLAALQNLELEIEGLDQADSAASIKQDVESFGPFRDEPLATKLEWLQMVLTQLGSFCVI